MTSQKISIVILTILAIVFSSSLATAQEDNKVHLPLIENGPTVTAPFTPTPTATATHTPTNTPTLTNTFTATPTPTNTNTPTSTPTSTPTVSEDQFDGQWLGTLSQGTPITFTISMHGIQEIWAEYSFDFGSCIVSGPAGWWMLNPQPFTGNSFNTTLTSLTTVAGTFDTTTTASGSLTVNVNQSGCHGTDTDTWTATKQ